MKNYNYSNWQMWALVTLRVAIGWHFFYEGLAKWYQPGWSAQGYLEDSQGFLAGIFYWLANQAGLIGFLDAFNITALLVIGLFLMLGFNARYATLGGIGLLVIYYLSHPAIPGVIYAAPTEGNYFFIDKNVIEFLALTVLWLFPTSNLVGVDRLLNSRRSVENKSLKPA